MVKYQLKKTLQTWREVGDMSGSTSNNSAIKRNHITPPTEACEANSEGLEFVDMASIISTGYSSFNTSSCSSPSEYHNNNINKNNHNNNNNNITTNSSSSSNNNTTNMKSNSPVADDQKNMIEVIETIIHNIKRQLTGFVKNNEAVQTSSNAFEKMKRITETILQPFHFVADLLIPNGILRKAFSFFLEGIAIIIFIHLYLFYLLFLLSVWRLILLPVTLPYSIMKAIFRKFYNVIFFILRIVFNQFKSKKELNKKQN